YAGADGPGDHRGNRRDQAEKAEIQRRVKQHAIKTPAYGPLPRFTGRGPKEVGKSWSGASPVQPRGRQEERLPNVVHSSTACSTCIAMANNQAINRRRGDQ